MAKRNDLGGAGDSKVRLGRLVDIWKLARMNLAIRGIDANLGPRNADSFRADLHPDLKADFILAKASVNKFMRRSYNG